MRPFLKPGKRSWLHFLALGLLLYLATLLWPEHEPPPEPVRLDETQVRELRLGWLRRTGNYPDARQMEALVEDAIDRELLFQEGLRLGLHRVDNVVWRRLVRNMRFTGMEGSDWKLLRQAFDFDMHRNDIVVRRRIIQVMEERARSLVAAPSEAELREQYQLRQEEFRRRLTSFRHIFSGYQERGAERAWAEILALRERCGVELFSGQRGDPHPAGFELQRRSDHQLMKYFGGDFVQALQAAPVGDCFGPVESAYGAHLVWVLERSQETRSFAQLRPRLHEDLVRSRSRAILREQLHELRRQRGM